MEYEATHPQAANPKVSRVETSEQFSFVLTQSYDAPKLIDGSIDLSKKMLFGLSTPTPLYPKIIRRLFVLNNFVVLLELNPI